MNLMVFELADGSWGTVIVNLSYVRKVELIEVKVDHTVARICFDDGGNEIVKFKGSLGDLLGRMDSGARDICTTGDTSGTYAAITDRLTDHADKLRRIEELYKLQGLLL